MNIELNQKQQILAAITLIIIILIVVFFVVIKPIFTDNELLKKQIIQEQQLKVLLEDIQIQLSSHKLLATLSQTEARNIINRVISVPKKITTQNDKIVVSITKQNFNRIANALSLLKNNYGIVITKADIKKVANGLVNANLTFMHL